MRLLHLVATTALSVVPVLALAQGAVVPGRVPNRPANDNGTAPANTAYVDAAAQALLNAINTRAPLANPVFPGTVQAQAFAGDVSGTTARPPGALLARSLAARASETINASDYFSCDGATDIRAGLVAAIAAAVPRPLYIPPQLGQCLLSAPVAPKSGLVIYAQRGTVTLAPTAGNTSNPALISMVVKTDVRLSGLGFEGRGADGPTAWALVTAYRTARVTIDGTDWARSRGSAILGSNAAYTTITNSTFTDIVNHWRTTGNPADRLAAIALRCNDATPAPSNLANVVRGNTFVDIGLDPISGTEQTDFSADGNTCVWTTVQSALISAPDYPACVYVAHSDGVTVSGNRSRQAPGNAFDIGSNVRFVVSGNAATGSGQAGVAADGAVGAIAGNVLTNNVQWAGSPHRGAISLFDARSVTVAGNTATDTQSTKTQPFGVWGNPNLSQAGSVIDQSNVLSGKGTGALGGKITAYGTQ